jgi:PKD repeat protein
MHVSKKQAFRYILTGIAIVLLLPACQKFKKTIPIAKFSYVKTCNGLAPCEVMFTNQSEYAESYKWSFGDGTSSVSKNPVHTYNGGILYPVKLWAIGREEETMITDTVFLVDRPACYARGIFSCVKKLTSGNAVSDYITSKELTNYYHFTPEKPGVVQIELNPVPAGGTITIEVITDLNSSQPLVSSTGRAGETIKFYAGPLDAKEHYLRVKQSYTASSIQPYLLTYTFINADPWELNNSFAQATPITTGQSLQGTIMAKGDNDYFTYNLTKDGIMNVTVTPVPLFAISNRLYLAAYYSASSTAQIKEVNALPGESIVTAVGPRTAGKYYLRLYGTAGAESISPYNITISYDTTDKYEINNTFSTGTSIIPGQSYKASIWPVGDLDYYAFTAIKNGPVTIAVPNVPEGLSYLIMDLFNSANTSSVILNNSASTNKPLTITSTFNLIANQKYYIKMYSSYSGESNKQYELKVQQ